MLARSGKRAEARGGAGGAGGLGGARVRHAGGVRHAATSAWARPDRALDYLERSVAERRGWLVYGKVNPIFDDLRNETRFKELLRQDAAGARGWN